MSRKKQILNIMTFAAAAAIVSGCGRPNNQSAALTGNSLYGGCIPLNQPIPFTAHDASADTYKIEAGLIPQYGGRSIGRVELGGAVSGGSFQRASADGTLSMQIQNSNYQAQSPQLPGSYQNYGYGYGNAMPTTVTGVLNLSETARNRIQQAVGSYQNNQGYTQYNGGYGQTLPQNNTTAYTSCVSGLAMTATYQGNQLTGGYIYLYMNNSQMMIQQLTL